MIRVRTGSRLHFGFLQLPGSESSRCYGGVGMMIDAPAVQLTFEPGQEWSASGPLAERALAYARQIEGARPGRLIVEACPPEHHGLGVGTQLGLAVAQAVANQTDALKLAKLARRGKRSSLGIHGFAHGGLLVEGGKREAMNEQIAPLIARHDFPEDWRVVLILPPWGRGLAGQAEIEALAHLPGQNSHQTETLCRFVLIGLLPALVEHDLPAFGEALYEFNRRVGEFFEPVQGGIYCHPRSQEVVDFICRQGVTGVGQSSWGPGLFALVENEVRGRELAQAVRRGFQLDESNVIVTRGRNRGAEADPLAA